MSKAKLVFPFIKVLLTKPSVIMKALYHAVLNTEAKTYAEKNFPDKKTLPVINILDLFPGMNETVDPFTHLYGTSLPIDMAVLKLLAKRFNGQCEYMEIGTWRGESIANMAQVCKKCVSLSLSDREMREFGMSEQMISVQRFFSKDIPNVLHLEGNSRTYDYSKMGKFDLIFVDGDHSFDGVKSDTQNVFNLLKDDLSIIVWHDYVTQYEQIDWEVYGGILAGTPADKRNHIYHISNTLCAIYINGKFNTTALGALPVPNKKFKVTISGEKL